WAGPTPAAPAGRTTRWWARIRAFNASPLSWQGFFERLDVAPHGYERLGTRVAPLGAVPPPPPPRAGGGILTRQEKNGSLGGLQLPWVFSVIALHASGYPLDDPALATGLRGLERCVIVEHTPEGTVRRFEAAQSHVWDTALATVALVDAGL